MNRILFVFWLFPSHSATSVTTVGFKYTTDFDKVLKNNSAIQGYKQYIIKNVNIGSVPEGNFPL